MVLADSVQISRVWTYSGSCPETSYFRIQDFHLLRSTFPGCSSNSQFSYSMRTVLQPQSVDWFGLLPVRSPLLRESFLLSSPPGNEMFQFPGLLLHTLCIHVWVTVLHHSWVPPFGYHRISACLPLPDAFRRLPRPSSASSAKAFTMRPY